MDKSIETAFTIMEVTRGNIKRIIDGHSIDQLNLIPEGFNNNLAWNFGHVVITQQLLVYGLSGLPLSADSELVTKYRKGSRPTEAISLEEIEVLKKMCDENIAKTKEDYSNGVFKEYKEYTTSYNMTLRNVNEAIAFNNVHESLHLGTCLDLKKFV